MRIYIWKNHEKYTWQYRWFTKRGMIDLPSKASTLTAMGEHETILLSNFATNSLIIGIADLTPTQKEISHQK